ATGRCMLRRNQAVAPPSDAGAARPAVQQTPRGSKPATPLLTALDWDDGPPWQFTVTITARDGGYAIEGWLARGHRRLDLSEALLVVADIVITRTHAARVDMAGAAAWMGALRTANRTVVPLDAREDLLAALTHAPPPVVDAPEDLRIQIVDGTPRPRLR